ncbi:hypothetical protein [Lacrimispora sp.]|uniref:hypothetical protein n=1 Tax=Lacrimispora sp. TaxID=2719234 RepID=UPI0029E2D406|nr:hypothetical protein [Lacrimispora sp.]
MVKIVYNDYQFYEYAALTELIEKQNKKGYSLCGMIGNSFKILKFCHTDTDLPKVYAIYCKHLDDEIDEEIEQLKTGKGEILCQNNRYIIFGFPSGDAYEKRSRLIAEKQNRLLGIPVKKIVVIVCMLLLISVITLVLKILLFQKGDLYFNQLNLALYLALIINFLIYFTGDLHDIWKGKGVYIEGTIYFLSRTKLKNLLFWIGDILRWVILTGSICISAAILISAKDIVLTVNLLRLWVIYGSVGFVYRLRVRGSYLSLLITQVLLAAFSFL